MAKTLKNNKELYNYLKILGSIVLVVIVVCLLLKMMNINMIEGFKGKNGKKETTKESLKDLLSAAEGMIEKIDIK
tara:strand:- start:226 stop:450 length:225 start_codon:yes stop_codon:yes gene_type:complete